MNFKLLLPKAFDPVDMVDGVIRMERSRTGLPDGISILLLEELSCTLVNGGSSLD